MLERDLKMWLELNNFGDLIKKQMRLFEDSTRNGLLMFKLLTQIGFLKANVKVHHRPRYNCLKKKKI